MCNLYSITTNQAAIAALSASSTAMSATSRRCPASSLGRDGLGYGRERWIMPVLLIVIVAVIILIAIMRSASKSKGMLVRQCPYCKNDINGKATVCDYCHRDVTGISS